MKLRKISESHASESLEANETSISAHRATKCSTDTTQLLSLFPTEIWTMVIDNIQSSGTYQDLENLLNASMYFRQLLSSDSIHFLFGKVLRVLENWKTEKMVERWVKGVPTESEIYKMGSLVTYYPDLNENPVLRLVCTSWNNVIQDKYHKIPSHFTVTTTNLNVVYYRSCIFQSAAKAERFLQHFRFSHSNGGDGVPLNPFISRSVTMKGHGLHLNPENARLDMLTHARIRGVAKDAINRMSAWADERLVDWNQAYLRDGFRKVLQTYGRHVWNLNMEIPPPGSMSVSVNCRSHCLYLRECLGYTGHLKDLRIAFEGIAPPPPQVVAGVTELTQFISDIPLLKLDQLECFRSENVPLLIFNEIVRANWHITRLQLSNFNTNYRIFTEENILPNLKSLSVIVTELDEFLYFENPKGSRWDLEEIYLTINNTSLSRVGDWARTLQLVEKKWGKSLERVELQLPKPANKKDHKIVLQQTEKLRWSLGRVKHLKLTLPNSASINFLLPLRNSLEYLHIIVQRDVMKGKNRTAPYVKEQQIQMIKFRGESPLEKSNIWSEFEKLSFLRITKSNTHVSHSVKNVKQ